MALQIGIAGIAGRMGRELVAAAAGDPELVLAGGVVRPGTRARGEAALAGFAGTAPDPRIAEDAAELLPALDVLIDFTTPAATIAHATAAAEAGRAIVVGTTGLGEAGMAALRQAAERVPVFVAPNMSLGLATLLGLLPALARALAGYDAEIVETHHRHKADAPSGTALALAQAIAAAAGGGSDRLVHGRQGRSPRRPGEIGVLAVRAGGNPGEHRILFADEGEQIELTHRAYSRRPYALGALRAAKFLAGRPPGLYGMPDLIQ